MTETEELTLIMDKDPIALTPSDISAIIAYHRRNRESGPRPKKETGPVAKIDLNAIGLKPSVPANPIKRRI